MILVYNNVVLLNDILLLFDLEKEYLYSKVHNDYGIYVGMKFIKLNAK